MTKEEILRILKDMNRNGFQNVLNDVSIEAIAERFQKRCKNRNIECENQEKELLRYFQIVLSYTTIQKRNFYVEWVEPYDYIYSRVNHFYHVTSSSNLEWNFINCCVAERMNYKQKTPITTRIQSSYKKCFAEKTKEERKREKTKTQPKKKEKLFLAKYCGQEETILYEMLSAFPKKEQATLLACKTEEELQACASILNKLNWALRYYPLLKYLGHPLVERQRMLSNFLQKGGFYQDIERNQIAFYKSLNPNVEIVIQEIKKLEHQNPELYHHLRMFLGYKNISIPLKILENSINIWLQKWQEKDLSNYSIYSKLEGIPLETVHLIIHCFQNSYKGYYEVLIKKYDSSLSGFHILNAKEEQKVADAIEKVKTIYKLYQQDKITLDSENCQITEKKRLLTLEEMLHKLSEEDKEFVRQAMLEKIKERESNLCLQRKNDNL